jgi:hypothetical protein
VGAGEGEVCTWFWWEHLRKRDHWEDPVVEGRIIVRWIFRKWDVGVWTGSIWLRIETGGGHLFVQVLVGNPEGKNPLRRPSCR